MPTIGDVILDTSVVIPFFKGDVTLRSSTVSRKFVSRIEAPFTQ